MERSPKSCIEAGEFAEYEQARLQEPGQEKIVTQDPRKKSTQEVPLRKCGSCGLIGRSMEDCRKRLPASQQSGEERGNARRYSKSSEFSTSAFFRWYIFVPLFS